MLVFAEAPYANATQISNYIDIIIIESTILMVLTIDYLLILAFLYHTKKLFYRRVFRNKKFMFKTIFLLLFYIDII